MFDSTGRYILLASTDCVGNICANLASLSLHVHMKDEEPEDLQVAQGTPVLLVIPVSPVFPAHSVAITIYAYEYTVWHGMASALYGAL